MTRFVLFTVVLLPCSLGAQEPQVTADEALTLLKHGNARFARDMPKEAELGSKRRIELAKGQKPIAVILTCADSRAAPEIIFDKGLGKLFVIRADRERNRQRRIAVHQHQRLAVGSIARGNPEEIADPDVDRHP